MADEADNTDLNIERDTAIALKLAAAHRPEAEETGFCLEKDCGLPVPKGHRWCDSTCRDLWQKRRTYQGRQT